MIASIVFIINWAAMSFILVTEMRAWDTWIQAVALFAWFVLTLLLAIGLSAIRYGSSHL